MGIYINPKDMTKEEFSIIYGTEITLNTLREIVIGTDKSIVPAIMIDNGAFKAFGIPYCENELNAFTRSDDYRPKSYFVFKRNDIEEHCPDLIDALKKYYD